MVLHNLECNQSPAIFNHPIQPTITFTLLLLVYWSNSVWIRTTRTEPTILRTPLSRPTHLLIMIFKTWKIKYLSKLKFLI